MARPVNVERLQSNIAWAVAHGLGARDLIPMLERLIRHAANGSDCKISAQRQLAELIVEHAPWRAALLTREVLQHKDDDRAWALFGLAHTLLGNHRVARRAYSRALARAPGCASYAHNLGHLIDVAFDQPREALRWLKQAHGHAPDEEEIAASYAHALARCQQVPEALAVLERVLNSRAKARALLQRWQSRRGGGSLHHEGRSASSVEASSSEARIAEFSDAAFSVAGSHVPGSHVPGSHVPSSPEGRIAEGRIAEGRVPEAGAFTLTSVGVPSRSAAPPLS